MCIIRKKKYYAKANLFSLRFTYNLDINTRVINKRTNLGKIYLDSINVIITTNIEAKVT